MKKGSELRLSGFFDAKLSSFGSRLAAPAFEEGAFTLADPKSSALSFGPYLGPRALLL